MITQKSLHADIINGCILFAKKLRKIKEVKELWTKAEYLPYIEIKSVHDISLFQWANKGATRYIDNDGKELSTTAEVLTAKCPIKVYDY